MWPYHFETGKTTKNGENHHSCFSIQGKVWQGSQEDALRDVPWFWKSECKICDGLNCVSAMWELLADRYIWYLPRSSTETVIKGDECRIVLSRKFAVLPCTFLFTARSSQDSLLNKWEWVCFGKIVIKKKNPTGEIYWKDWRC